MARCCVRGCNKRSPADVKFYRFPGRAWQSHIMAKWIEFVNRIRNDGAPWYPNKDSRVCSSHFIGNAKSHNPASPSFVPTIAPGQTSQLIVAAGHGLDSFHRPATEAEFGLLVDCLRDAELRRENSDGQSTICEPDIEGMLLSAEFQEEFVTPTESSANCSTPENSVARSRVPSVSSNEMTWKIDDVTASDFADTPVASEWPLQCVVKEEPEASDDDDDPPTDPFSVEESDTSRSKLDPKLELANELDLDAAVNDRLTGTTPLNRPSTEVMRARARTWFDLDIADTTQRSKELRAVRPESRTESSPPRYGCPYCGQQLASSKDLSVHVAVHAAESPSKVRERLEIDFHSITGLTAAPPFQCHLCKTSFAREDELRNHYFSDHKLDREVVGLVNVARKLPANTFKPRRRKRHLSPD